MVNLEAVPGWIELLVSEKFFNSCLVHESEKKNEGNTFCFDCCATLCFHCLPSHPNHRLLQIRRYVYQDVLRLKDAAKVMDCSLIQSYTTNSAKVLFLKQRPNAKRSQAVKGSSGSFCVICERNLQSSYLFCSIFCKVSYTVSNSASGDDHHLATHSSILINSSVPSDLANDNRTPVNAQFLQKKKRSSFSAQPPEFRHASSRRKSVPRRAPLIG